MHVRRTIPKENLKTSGRAWDIFSKSLPGANKYGCVTVAKDGLVYFANRLAREELGMQPGSPLAASVPELLKRVEQVLKGESDPGGTLLKRGEVAYLTNVSPIEDGGAVVGALCVFIEMAVSETIARQMRVYAELTWEQDAIINALSEGLWICDSNANVLRINPASERLNRIKASEAVGRNMQDLVNEGFCDRSATLEVLRNKAPISMLQTLHEHQLVLTTGTPVFDETGNIIRVVVTERDITEIEALHKELEEQAAMKDRIQDHMLEMQLEETESRRVIAKSACMQKALRKALKVATFDSTVLLLGESGVGKELFADLIYKYSQRTGKPLVKINCGAIPESLLEAELFGYEKGAFTGAQVKGKPGYFELADEGILFLDEIGELTLSSQVKLLRFLEDGKVTRVGATKSRTLNVRVLAATHQDLKAMVERGTFRLDLYYRLSVIPIQIPPLRERVDCIMPLVRHYIEFFAERLGASRRLTHAASDALLAYSWPGNVRELANLCEHLVVMSESELIGVSDIPPEILGKMALAQASPEETSLAQVMDNTERVLLIEAKQRHGTQALMAKALGIDRSTVARKMAKYGIV